jgi:chemotaxis protein methyltransferase CheR
VSIDADTGQQRVLTANEFDWLRRFLFERTGIELKDGKEPMVMGRLDRRLRHHGMSSYAQYLQVLAQGDAAEVQMAVDLLTTNETYFFREPQHFDFLRDLYAGRRAPAEPIRVWSAASSSGEEAYTIAMVLASTLPAGQAWEIVGTDISTRVLETARRGMYPIEASAKIPRPFLRDYCLRGRDDYEGFLAIDRGLRGRVVFREANLTDVPEDLGMFDVIFLRNVMIYFGPDTKQRLVSRVVRMLRPGGHLLVSHSETLSGMQSGLEMVRPSIYRRGDDDG